jgi:hypothetical protein
MPKFKDNNNHEWDITLSFPITKQIRQSFNGLDLLDPSFKSQEQLASDYLLLSDVLWALCKEQAGQISEAAFGTRVTGDALTRGLEALTAAIAEILPTEQRLILLAAEAHSKAMRETAVQKALDTINDPAFADRVIEQLERNIRARVDALVN